MSSTNLVDFPWIDCLATDGQHRTVGLRDLLRDADHLTLTESAPLVEAAIWRLLAAICYAAGNYPTTTQDYHEQIRRGPDLTRAVDYLDSHCDSFELFHPTAPFGQDPTLATASGTESARPAIYLDLTAAIDRPLLYDTRHLAAAQPLTAVQALRALLVQNQWGFGGRSQGKAKDLGGDRMANYGLATPLNGRIVLCPDTTTIAAGLAWRITPTSNPGTPTWTYPQEASTSTPEHFCGQASGLTWLTRRVLLFPGHDDLVHRVAIARGRPYVDLPKLLENPGATPDLTGWADVLLTAKTGVAGQAINAADDLVSCVANLANTRAANHIDHLLDAAAQLGHAPNLVAISLVAALRGQKKADVVRRVNIPAAVFTEPAAIAVAQKLLDLRRLMAGSASRTTDVPLYRRWLASPTSHATRQLLHDIGEHVIERVIERPNPTEPLIKTIIDIRSAVARAAAALDVPLSESGDTMATELDYGFDDDLFTTCDTAPPDSAATDDPCSILLGRVYGYARNGQHRGTMAQLRGYAQRPTITNTAMALAVRGLPIEHRTAATTIATLYASWHQRCRTPAGFVLPLARAARQFGGVQRGPANTRLRVLMDRAVHTRADKLLPTLHELVCMAARHKAHVNWRDLYTTVLDWDSDATTRLRWSALFHTTHKLSDLDRLIKEGKLK